MPTFSYTGAEQTWVVPAGVTSVQVECWGAQAGDTTGSSYPNTGANGGYAKGELAVSPGETLRIYVGGRGGSSSGNSGGYTVRPGGWNGGGPTQTYGNGSGGGGASDVRRGGSTLADRVIVAGGGGGVGWSNSDGGAGGGTTGEGGQAGGSGTGGGGGGTQSSGGAYGPSSGTYKTAGSLGQGGTGSGSSEGGGGGGGGYYGGGGGGYNDGGGGGSGYIGGVANGIMSTGVRSGDGQVVITILNDPPVATITSHTDGEKLDPRIEHRVTWNYSDTEGAAQQKYRVTRAKGDTTPVVFAPAAPDGRDGTIQSWTVPATGRYRLKARGAGSIYNGYLESGRGAIIEGDFDLDAGDVIKIIAGQTGKNNVSISYGMGGGGGSFIYNETKAQLLVAAGGGGGAGGASSGAYHGCDASLTTAPNNSNGTYTTGPSDSAAGEGGKSSYYAGGGAGWNSNGDLYSGFTVGGFRMLDPIEPGAGGHAYSNNTTSYTGGFGGGGGGSSSGDTAGGGGGYTGGNGGSTTDYPGGGGGSYNAGTNQTATLADYRLAGEVTVQLVGDVDEVTSANQYHDILAGTLDDEQDYTISVEVFDGTSWSAPASVDIRSDSWTYGAEVLAATEEVLAGPFTDGDGDYEAQVRTADAIGFGSWSTETVTFFAADVLPATVDAVPAGLTANVTAPTTGVGKSVYHNAHGPKFQDTKTALVYTIGGGWDLNAKLAEFGYTVTHTPTRPTFDDAREYDLFGVDSGYNGIDGTTMALAEQLFNYGVSVYTTGNDTTDVGPLTSGSSYQPDAGGLNPFNPAGSHPAAQGWPQFNDGDARTYYTEAQIAPGVVVVGTGTFGGVPVPMLFVYEHPNGNGARWGHIQPYAATVPSATKQAFADWLSEPRGDLAIYSDVVAPVITAENVVWNNAAASPTKNLVDQVPQAIGGATMQTGISWQGKTWRRATHAGSNSIIRQYTALANLKQGVTYTTSVTVANDTNVNQTVALDFCDGNRLGWTLAPREVKRISTSYAGGYSSTYSFADLEPTTVGGSVLFRDWQIEEGSAATDYFTGDNLPGDKNLAFGVTAITGTDPLLPNPGFPQGPPSSLTNETLSADPYVAQSPGLKQITVDLGEVKTIDEVRVWHYHADNRRYYKTKTQVSRDGVNWITVFDSAVDGEYQEYSTGKIHTFAPTGVRYIRDWLNGSTSNTGNHWVEIQAYHRSANTYKYEWNGTPNASTSTRKKTLAANLYMPHPHVGAAYEIDVVPAFPQIMLFNGGPITIYWNGLFAVSAGLSLAAVPPTTTVYVRPITPTYTTEQYRAKFTEGFTRITRRIEILNSDGQTLWDDKAGNRSRLITGNISVDYDRDERRSADLELANFDNALVHKPEGFWYDKVLRAWRGIEFYDVSGKREYEVPVGSFMIDRVSEARFPKTVKVTARDFTKKCLLSKFTQATGFTANQAIEDVIAAMAGTVGVAKRVFPVTGKTLGVDTFFERGKSRWEAMKEIATANGYELFFDAYGYLVMRPYLDPTLSPVAHEFLTGPTVGNLVDWERSANDTRIFNHISVIGADTDTIPVWADAYNTNPLSPTNIDLLGDRVDTFESALVTTFAQAEELAETFLKVSALEEYEINMSSIVYPWLEAGEIVRFVDPERNDDEPDRFLLTSFNVPMGLEPMSAVGRRVVIVS